MNEDLIKQGQDHFGKLVEEQILRVEKMKSQQDWIDYTELKPIIIGIVGGDGIGPIITKHAENILKFLLDDEEKSGKVQFKEIKGLTIENRVKVMKAIPDDILEEIKKCHVILKGPTTTPKKGDPWPNIESANVSMRRELDLFANVRPVKVPKDNIDWVFFRENTEGAYILGSKGIALGDDITFDFKVITKPGAERIIRLAFDYAKNNGINRITCVTKSNILKTTDGTFLQIFYDMAKEYPQIKADDWFVDIITAKLLDPKRRQQFKVFVLPNLYGDIVTDEAAELQGGVGTAGSSNIGKRYAMFEAIHGSAPRMVEEGRAKYADPSSIIRAAAMLLRHINVAKSAERLEKALDICTQYEKKVVLTGHSDGVTGNEFVSYLIETIKSPDLDARWEKYSE